jgi:hypothetical protein
MQGVSVFKHLEKTNFCSVRKRAVSATQICNPTSKIILANLQLLAEMLLQRKGNVNKKINTFLKTCKCKAIPLQAWTGPKCSSSLGLPHFKTDGT